MTPQQARRYVLLPFLDQAHRIISKLLIMSMVSGNLLHDIFVNLVLEEVIYSMVWSGPKAARSASSQAEAIRLIADHQPLTMTQLGTMLIRESGTNPSRLVGRLVASGQIERKINAADRCAVSLRLTSQGSGAAVQIVRHN